jgi:endogenous inhibitor of DNA gyrase (YacG/DUF329 family)
MHSQNGKTKHLGGTMIKKCQQCRKDFEAEMDDIRAFCSDECKQEALAQLDKGSDECLSCQ